MPTASAGPAQPSAGAAASLEPLPADRIQILHTNDIHGRLDSVRVVTGSSGFEQGSLAMIGGMIAKHRARAPERTLVLDAGDAWVGQLISSIDRGKSLVAAMSLAGYDAQALGNHDFDWGQEELAARASEASFPFLTANVVLEATGDPPPFARPYVVKDLGITRVAVIGLTYPSSSIIRAASVRGLRFGPPVEAVRRYLPEMQRQADVIVALTHLGLDGGSARLGGDTELAMEVPEIDLIVGGHDHQAFRTARAVGETKIFQAGANGENLGRAEVTIDPATRKVAAVKGSDALLVVSTGAAEPHPEIAKLVAERREEASKYASRVVGRTNEFLQADRDMDDPLGNLVADALLDYGRQQGWETDLAFYNGAGLRASIGMGDISYGKLAEVLPFGNTVVSVDLTGEQVKEVFEGMAGAAGRLFMAGGTMSYRFANPSGARVLSATVGGLPLDPARVYRVATIDYLQGGGDGHTGFRKGTNVIYGDVDVDVVAAYIEAHSPLAPKSPGRVTQE
ncbi:MAG: bifunctional metallophosphatase/5'-nucleotidase [Candidatus Limnocylindria bacterium]